MFGKTPGGPGDFPVLVAMFEQTYLFTAFHNQFRLFCYIVRESSRKFERKLKIVKESSRELEKV